MRIGHNTPQDLAGGRARWKPWRTQRLRSAGFPGALADRIACEDQVDLHELLELVDRGCPPHLAARIVAPLDQNSGQS